MFLKLKNYHYLLLLYIVVVIALLYKYTPALSSEDEIMINLKLLRLEARLRYFLVLSISDEKKSEQEADYLGAGIETMAEQYKGNSSVLEELATTSASVERHDIVLRILPLIYKTGGGTPLTELLLDIAMGAVEFDEANVGFIENLNTASWVKTGLLSAYYRAAEMTSAADIYRKKLLNDTYSLLLSGALLFIFFAGSLVAGVIIAFLSLRKKGEVEKQPGDENPSFLKGHEILITTLLLWFTFFLTLSILLPSILTQIPALKDQLALQLFLSYLATSLAALYIVSRALKSGTPLFQALGWRGIPSGIFKPLFIALSFYCVSLLPIFMVSAVSQSLFESKMLIDNPIIPLLIEADDYESRIILFLTVAVVAPFFEELFFRGYVYSKLKEFTDARKSALGAGAIFAAAHLSLVNLLPLTLLGYFLARSYEKSGNILTPMLYHSLWNSGSYFVIIFVFSS